MKKLGHKQVYWISQRPHSSVDGIGHYSFWNNPITSHVKLSIWNRDLSVTVLTACLSFPELPRSFGE